MADGLVGLRAGRTTLVVTTSPALLAVCTRVVFVALYLVIFIWSANRFGVPVDRIAVKVLLRLTDHMDELAGSLPHGLQRMVGIGIAFLMASRIPHFSGKRIGRIPRDLVIPVLFGVGVTALLLPPQPASRALAPAMVEDRGTRGAPDMILRRLRREVSAFMLQAPGR